MRLLFSIYMLTLTTFCFGQDLKLVKTETEEFYQLLQDSINPEFNYPDGRYKVFLSDTNKLPRHVFYLKEGKIEGPYLKLTTSSWTYGNYLQDSLWTFLTNSEDTTFKIGTWRTTYAFYSGFSGKYDNYSTTEIKFKMPFDINGKFTEVWRFHNGKLAREATHVRSFGLEKETYWDFETNNISKQTINKGNKNFYQSIVYENDSISNISIIQDGIEVNLNFDYPLCSIKPCFGIQIYSDNWERSDLPMTTLTIDSTKTLTNFSDVKRQILIRENKDGNVSIEYVTKNGKRKYKTLKIK